MTEIGLLGSLYLRDSEGRECRSLISRPKLVALLAYLAAARPLGFHRRDRLVSVFWPELDQAHARNALRQALHHLRNALGHEAIVGRGEEELGLNAAQVRCDVAAFHTALEEGRLAAALELYRGELLPGFHVSDASQFERWLEGERDYLAKRAASAAWTLAEEEEAAGNGVASAYWARRALDFSPYDESVLCRLIQLLDRLGDRAGAVQEFEKFARRLADDLEVEASPETKSLIEAVRTRDDLAAPRSQPVPDAPSPASTASEERKRRRSAARPWFRLAARIVLGRFGVVARLVLVALVAAAIYLVVEKPWESGEGIAVSATRIAVFPFPVQGGEQLDNLLCEGMVELLGTIFHGAGRFSAVDARTVLSRVGRQGCDGLQPARAREVAADMGAGLFVLGDIREIGGSLRFNATLFDAGGRQKSTAQATAESENEIDGAVDELARQLLSVVSPARLDSLAAWTTPSITALKDYLLGQHAMRIGKFGDAVEAFRRAVAEDPEFALAYYGLNEAASATWLRPEVVRDAAEQAVRLSGRLSERDSALLEASRAQQVGAAVEAERRYKAITGAQPDDAEAWFGLAETQFHYGPLQGRPLSESREAFEHVLWINQDDGFSLYHLAVIAATEGDVAEMDSLVWVGVNTNPEHASNPGMLTLQAFVHGDSLAREGVVALLSDAGDFQVGVAVGIVAIYSGDLQGGERVARLLTVPRRTGEVRAVGRVVIAHLKLAQGLWGEARVELAAAARLDPAVALEYRALIALAPFLPVPRDELEALRRELTAWDADAVPANLTDYVLYTAHDGLHPVLRAYLLGVLSARLDDDSTAAQYAEQLEDTSGPPWAEALPSDLALTVRAEVARANGDLEEALRLLSATRMETWYQLTAVSSFHSQAHGRFLRAELLRQLGRDREALRWYSTFEHVSPHDLIFLGPALRRQGELLERLGRRDQAVERYQRFLDLWSDCDPELQAVWVDVDAQLDGWGAE